MSGAAQSDASKLYQLQLKERQRNTEISNQNVFSIALSSLTFIVSQSWFIVWGIRVTKTTLRQKAPTRLDQTFLVTFIGCILPNQICFKFCSDVDFKPLLVRNVVRPVFILGSVPRRWHKGIRSINTTSIDL